MGAPAAIVLIVLAVLSFGIVVWQFLAARRFPLHRRDAVAGFAPAVTLLKPLKGRDEHTRACLESWLVQDYAGPVQVVFAVQDPADPVCEVVRELLAAHPGRDARLCAFPDRIGANAKVSQLAQAEPLAVHGLVLVSDADVRVPRDFLATPIGSTSTRVTSRTPSASSTFLARSTVMPWYSLRSSRDTAVSLTSIRRASSRCVMPRAIRSPISTCPSPSRLSNSSNCARLSRS